MFNNWFDKLRELFESMGDDTKPRMDKPLKVGQSNEFFEVIGAGAALIKDNVLVTPVENDDGTTVALLLNNGKNGALVCFCPEGYKGECGSVVYDDGKKATCHGTCDHSEVDLNTPCRLGWVAGNSISGGYFKPA